MLHSLSSWVRLFYISPGQRNAARAMIMYLRWELAPYSYWKQDLQSYRNRAFEIVALSVRNQRVYNEDSDKDCYKFERLEL